MKCEKCNTDMMWEEDKVYTSIPPMYGYVCPKCGHVQYSRIPNEQSSVDNDTATEMTDFEKRVSNIILSWKGDSNYSYLDKDHQIETLKKQCELILSYAKKELEKDLPKISHNKPSDDVLYFGLNDWYLTVEDFERLPKEE